MHPTKFEWPNSHLFSIGLVWGLKISRQKLCGIWQWWWVWMLSDGNDGNDDADDNGTDAAYALVRWDRGGCDARWRHSGSGNGWNGSAASYAQNKITPEWGASDNARNGEETTGREMRKKTVNLVLLWKDFYGQFGPVHLPCMCSLLWQWHAQLSLCSKA